MEIHIANEAAAIQAATATGFNSVEEYFNQTIKQSTDLAAIRQGIDDVRAGRMGPLAEFDQAFRAEMGFAPRAGEQVS